MQQAPARQPIRSPGRIFEKLANEMIADELIIPMVNPDLFLANRAIHNVHYSACCNLDLGRLLRVVNR